MSALLRLIAQSRPSPRRSPRRRLIPRPPEATRPRGVWAAASAAGLRFPLGGRGIARGLGLDPGEPRVEQAQLTPLDDQLPLQDGPALMLGQLAGGLGI